MNDKQIVNHDAAGAARRAKIIATLGPASHEEEQLLALAQAGANVFRLNFSHADYEFFDELLARIERVRAQIERPLAVLADISGPKIRVKNLAEPVDLKPGDELVFFRTEAALQAAAPELANRGAVGICINYPEAISKIKTGEFIYLCDGAISVQVERVDAEMAAARVQVGGKLMANKGINFPNTELGIDILTPKDRKDIAWARERGVDYFALSFVQSADDILRAKELAGGVKILAKIEKFDAIKNIEAILDAADGIMIARGDLGIELPYYQLPVLQKRLIKLARDRRKICITATQMLLSLTTQKTATRAEISDVANAIIDGSCACMLSEESAVGIAPANAVAIMARTMLEAQPAALAELPHTGCEQTESVLRSALAMAEELAADGIICLSNSGASLQTLSALRPNVPIIAVSDNPRALRGSALLWGVGGGVQVPSCSELDELIGRTIAALLGAGQISLDGCYLIVAGYPVGISGCIDMAKILRRASMEYYLAKVR